jgi:RNA 2',3'-cyclic 3'-phosphodiesterase
VTRAFIAVRPPDAVLDAIAQCVDGVRDAVPDARWAAREQWHVTLQFLGNRADVDAVVGALADLGVGRAVAALGGGGAFASARRASVCWIGFERGSEFLAALAGRLQERTRPLGHEPEKRKFHPHITVARSRGRRPLDARGFVGAVPASVGEPWMVDEIVVYESKLRPSGAEYVPRAVIPLA